VRMMPRNKAKATADPLLSVSVIIKKMLQILWCLGLKPAEELSR
jgi:hypothetical protein